MTRPLRIQFPYAVYHVTSRGNARADIFVDDIDRQTFLSGISFLVTRYNWVCHAYCLMDNHYHLLVETPDANLSQGMRQLNGTYTQSFNRRHNRTGHIFQSRFKAIIIEKATHLLESCRYVVLNPVRAEMVTVPGQWRWSSYTATEGTSEGEAWLTCDWILSQFGSSRHTARKNYRKFVYDGMKNSVSPWGAVKGGLILGSDAFVALVRDRIGDKKEITEVPKTQRLLGRPSLEEVLCDCTESFKDKRNSAITLAHVQYGYSLKEIADHLYIHYSSVSRIVKSQSGKM
jgi:putative transposase